MCVCGAKKSQGLNLNLNPGLSFAGKLSHWLKGGMWVLYFLSQTLPAATLDWQVPKLA